MSSAIAESAWPGSVPALVAEQNRLAVQTPEPWKRKEPLAIAGCFVCFPRGESGPGAAGDPAWAASALMSEGRLVSTAAVRGTAGAPYCPGLLALREGALLEAAVRSLDREPDVLLVDATGRDHPRRAGLALHLGAVLGVPSIGVTHRLLLADGPWPEDRGGAASPFRLGLEVAGYWMRTRATVRPLAIHAGWRIDPEQALAVVRLALGEARTPEPLRQARRLARAARSATRGGAFDPF